MGQHRFIRADISTPDREGGPVLACIDTGSPCCVISISHLRNLGLVDEQHSQLHPLPEGQKYYKGVSGPRHEWLGAIPLVITIAHKVMLKLWTKVLDSENT